MNTEPTNSRWLIVAAIVALAVLAVASGEVATIGHGRPFWLDQPIYDVFASSRNSALVGISTVLQVVGGTLGTAIITAILAVVFVVLRRWQDAATLVLTVIVATSAAPLLKLIVGRARPAEALISFGSQSFPSGHATAAAALTVALALTIRSAWMWAIVAVWVPAVAASRLILRVHWFSDVVAGAVLGAAVAILIAAAMAAVFWRPRFATFLKEHSRTSVKS